MQYLKTYLKKITDRGNTKLAESIEKQQMMLEISI